MSTIHVKSMQRHEGTRSCNAVPIISWHELSNVCTGNTRSMRGPTHQSRDDGADRAQSWSALEARLTTDPGQRLCHHSQQVALI